MQAKILIQTARPPFLVLAPICVLLGFASVHAAGHPIDPLIATLVLTGAVAAHVSVNMLNEYHDFRSGLDMLTTRTPFSGGSGALPDAPHMAEAVRRFAYLMLLLTVAAGLCLLAIQGANLLPVGLLGIAVVFAYTPWLNRSPLLCLLAPGMGFGLLMVVGTYVALTGEYDLQPLLLSLPPFFLVNNLLLLNQYPDVEADHRAGRRHFPVHHGTETSNLVYAAFAYVSYALIVLYVLMNMLPALSLIALIPAFLSAIAIRGALRYRESIGSQPLYLAANVAASLLTPLLLAVSLWLE